MNSEKAIVIPVRLDEKSFKRFAFFDIFVLRKKWIRPLVFSLILIAFAFVVLLARKEQSGLIAAVSYVFYWLLQRWGVADALSVFSGALLGSLLGHLLARKLRIIHTVFLMAAIVPVVPGLGLYRMMASFGRGETMLGANLGIEAMITIAMLALGLSMGSFINRVIRNAGASASEKKQRTK